MPSLSRYHKSLVIIQDDDIEIEEKDLIRFEDLFFKKIDKRFEFIKNNSFTFTFNNTCYSRDINYTLTNHIIESEEVVPGLKRNFPKMEYFIDCLIYYIEEYIRTQGIDLNEYCIIFSNLFSKINNKLLSDTLTVLTIERYTFNSCFDFIPKKLLNHDIV